MAIVITDSQHYTNIAAAIRAKNGTEVKYKPSEMAAAIGDIPTATVIYVPTEAELPADAEDGTIAIVEG